MKRTIHVKPAAPQYSVITNITFAQTDAWFGHTTQDLRMDLIYPEDTAHDYPCIVWICGGAWLSIDKSAHLAYLSELARAGFVVASVQYRTSNEAKFPAQLCDVKAAIRYLRAHAARYHIDEAHIGVMGESAGGYLTCMAALCDDPAYEVGEYLSYSSKVQAACPWYPPTDFRGFLYENEEQCAASPESLLMGKNAMRNPREALACCPVSFVTKDAPPFFIIHGKCDKTVPFTQGVELHDELEKEGSDVTLLEIEDADHADIRFFQEEIWQEIITFLKQNYKKKTAADSSKMEKWRILLSEKWAYSRKLFAICHFQPICVYKLPPRYYSQGLAKFIKLDKQDVHHQCHTVCSLITAGKIICHAKVHI